VGCRSTKGYFGVPPIANTEEIVEIDFFGIVGFDTSYFLIVEKLTACYLPKLPRPKK
jgi:hypothetical protein